MSFKGIRVGVVALPALGDATLYLYLAWLFHRDGASVTLFSNTLFPAKNCFPWLEIKPDQNERVEDFSASYDLVIACFERCYRKETSAEVYAALENVAFVTAKKISRESGLYGRQVVVRDKCFVSASVPFCSDTRAGLTMVDWIDLYVQRVFDITVNRNDRLVIEQLPGASSRRVVVFPTTPQEKKNYWLRGFRLLAQAIRSQGWVVEFVCMPDERDRMVASLPGFEVNTFPDVGALMEYLASASAVISNDSGGGHLASLLGIPTFTVTRRRHDFVWRPGFNQANTVLYPLWRFKWMGDYVWRPFVPVWRIAKVLGSPS